MTEAVLSISTMSADDLPQVLAIEKACYDFPWSEELILNCLEVGYHALTLREAEDIRAYAFASSAAGESHILNICVDPSYRSMGYAKLLMQQCIATVMVHGAKVMFLEVRESNHRAIALYESIGFVEIGRRDDYYRLKARAPSNSQTNKSQNRRTAKKAAPATREDALVMSRDLTIITSAEDI